LVGREQVPLMAGLAAEAEHSVVLLLHLVGKAHLEGAAADGTGVKSWGHGGILVPEW
jgi:hypothetical protein